MAAGEQAYSRGRFIAHAGGAVGGRKYTNSVEAFEAAASTVKLIELDICRARDGLIVAHDGLENAYGIKEKFDGITLDEFRSKRFVGKLRTMTLPDLLLRLCRFDTSVILDIKAEDAASYARTIAEISEMTLGLGVRDKLIPQTYCEADLDAASAAGFENTILALWKHYPNVFTPECQACIEYAFGGQGQHDGFRALSMAARHFWRQGDDVAEGLQARVFTLSPMVFLHGQPAEAEGALLKTRFRAFYALCR